MSRPFRVEYTGAIYHITSRGIDRRIIFNDENDYQHFIQLLKEGADFFRVEVISYCLMNNHFHVLLKTREANLSRFMQRLNVAYTRYFNHKYKRVGPLMQGRYKAILVGSDEYFLVLSRYIHLNPVSVKGIKGKGLKDKERVLINYKWSSYLAVIDPSKRSEYFKVEEVLGYTGGDTQNGREKYREYILEGLNNEIKVPLDEVKYQLILGTEKFVEWVKDKFIKGRDLKAHPMLKGVTESKAIKEIAEKVAKIYNVDAKDLIKKKSKFIEARNMLIELSYLANINVKSLCEIGKELGGITGSGVGYAHNRIREKMKNDKSFQKRFLDAGKSLSILET